MADDDVTIGEVGRRLQTVESDVRGVQTSLTEIKTTLASQSVKVGVVWSALGVASASLISSMVTAILLVMGHPK